jgi:hypothetical protein
MDILGVKVFVKENKRRRELEESLCYDNMKQLPRRHSSWQVSGWFMNEASRRSIEQDVRRKYIYVLKSGAQMRSLLIGRLARI